MEADNLSCVKRSIPNNQKGEYCFTPFGKQCATAWLFYSPEVVDCPMGVHGSHTMHRWGVVSEEMKGGAVMYPTWVSAWEAFRQECDK